MVVQWIRTSPASAGISLLQEDLLCCRTAKPCMLHGRHVPRECAQQQEKLRHDEKPVYHSERSGTAPQNRELIAATKTRSAAKTNK